MDEYRMIEGKDLVAFLSGFVAFIKKAIGYLLLSIRHRFVVFISIFILIAGAGFLRWYYTPVYYQSQMACSFADDTKKFYGDMLHRLDVLSEDHAYNTLASLLDISTPQASNIISITGKNMAGSLLYEDITQAAADEPFYIEARVKDTALFTPLQTALIKYLNYSSPSLVASRKRDLQDIQTRRDSVKDNIATLDAAIRNSPGDENLVSMVNYKDSLQLLVLEQNRHIRALQSSVAVLHGFTPSQNPVRERNKDLQLAIIGAVLAACLASMVSEIGYNKESSVKKAMARA